MTPTMGGNLGLSHGGVEGASMWPDRMVEGSPDPIARGKNSHNDGNKKDQPGDQKFNRKVPLGYDTKIGPHTGSDAAQVAEDFQPPDADYWEEIMPQFDLDGAIAEGDILVEEIAVVT